MANYKWLHARALFLSKAEGIAAELEHVFQHLHEYRNTPRIYLEDQAHAGIYFCSLVRSCHPDGTIRVRSEELSKVLEVYASRLTVWCADALNFAW